MERMSIQSRRDSRQKGTLARATLVLRPVKCFQRQTEDQLRV